MGKERILTLVQGTENSITAMQFVLQAAYPQIGWLLRIDAFL